MLIIIEVDILVFEIVSRMMLEVILYKTYIRLYTFRRISFNQILLNIYRPYFDYILIYIYYISYLYLKISCFDKKWNF